MNLANQHLKSIYLLNGRLDHQLTFIRVLYGLFPSIHRSHRRKNVYARGKFFFHEARRELLDVAFRRQRG